MIPIKYDDDDGDRCRVCVLLVTTVSRTKQLNQSRCHLECELEGQRTMFLVGPGSPTPPGKWAFLVGEKHWEYLTCNSYSHPYSEGGSSDVAFCSHYCSYLFSVLLDMLIVSVSNLQMRQSRCIRNVCRNLLVSDTNFSNFWSRYTVQHGMNQN